ncbi:hypothetical protein F511_34405 [Dorcoceras hygrometricum]|uniref:CCHC-type domain-containing protein n=1 Tax=Dorcoceras hygrometricum TaxID=472368 RepID=A0A2Z7AL07_9LAMI|nr:hypothetical protein F511_34405 [Dorcoceras hygrometricum]
MLWMLWDFDCIVGMDVQGSCNLCGQYGHFARVCPTAGAQQTAAQPQGRGGQSRGRSQQFQQPRFAGAQQTAAQPQGRGGQSRGRSQQFQQPRFGETQIRPFQQPGPSRFGQPSQPFFPGPQHAQVNAFTREQAEETPSRVIGGTCLVFDFPARVLFDTGASHSFISDSFVVEHGLLAEPLGSLAFKMVQVRQLRSEREVKLGQLLGGMCLSMASVFRVKS